jgi:hypothetical protein
MGSKLRKLTLSVLVAGLAVALWAPSAEANRGHVPVTTTAPIYVPPPQFGQNPLPQLPDVPNLLPPIVVTVELPAVTAPEPGPAGGADTLSPNPGDGSTVVARSETGPEPQPANGGGTLGPAGDGSTDPGPSETRPEPPPANSRGFGGIPGTGSETLPLARAGLAALALGIGLVVLARRRRRTPPRHERLTDVRS